MFIRGIFRLVYYAFLAYMAWSVYRMIAGLGKRRPRPTEKSRLTGVMVKDEVCGTYLPKENALRESIEGRERFFCSRECRAKALAGNRSGDKPQ
jgi:uncharacterized protein